MQKRLTVALLVLVFLIVTGLVGWNFLGPRTVPDDSTGSLNRPLRVGIVSWPGYAGGLIANNGFAPNKHSIYWTKYHQLVQFELLEDVDARAKAFARGDIDVVWTTVDFWANELPGFAASGVPAKAIMQVDWSRGGDAIVADSSIRSVEDLKGKKIALALLTPSQWLLENALSKSRLSAADVTTLMKSAIAKNASPDARSDFVAGRVDAAVVWEPDVTEALQKRPGAHILVSSRDPGFDHLLADCMVVRQEFIDEHPDAVRAFVRGWFDGTEVARKDHALVVKLLMDNEPLYKSLGEVHTRHDLDTVKWADMPDNISMFGLDGQFSVFDQIFTRASQLWLKRGVIAKVASPEDAVDVEFLREIRARQR